MATSNKVVFAVMEAMWSSGESFPSAYERALQILAWALLSERREVGEGMSLEVAVSADDLQLGAMIESLTSRDRICAQAFDSLRTLKKDQLLSLRSGMRQGLKLQAQGVLSSLPGSDLSVSGDRETDFTMPSELADLLLGLEPDLGRSIYVAWDVSGLLTSRALRTGATVHVDIPGAPAIACLSGLIAGGELTVEKTDPIREPSAVSQGRLTTFSSAIAFPPVGQRYEPETAERDLFGRFPERTTLASVLSIRHLLAVAESRVVVCVPNSFTFGANADYALRKSLVENGQLRAVISLPQGLLSMANIALSILVLSPAGGERTVRVVNADDDRFRRTALKARRSELTDTAALIETVNSRGSDSFARDVSNEEIADSDYQLQVSRYLVPEHQKKVQALLGNAKLVPLGTLVEMIRPPVVKAKEEANVLLQEIGVADLPPFGHIDQPGRLIEVDDEMAKKLTRYHLRPFDIVLAIKGSVGKIGFVPQSVEASDLPWVVGQSSVALRVTSQLITPKALFMMLRSGLGQTLIKGIVSAGTIPFIQTRELEALEVPLPPMAEQSQAAEILDREVLLQQEISHLQHQLAQLSQPLWAL